jgi:sugar lactone lactonase YvrE
MRKQEDAMRIKQNLARSSVYSSTTGLMLVALFIITLVMMARGPERTVQAQPPLASMLIAPHGEPGSDPAHLNPVLRFQFTGTGPLSGLSSIPSTPATSVNDPIFAAFNARGELFVGNRHGNIGGGVGSISRFTFDSSGNFFDNGTITGNSLEAVHGLAFSPSGELFAANLFNGHISRFLFDPSGNAVANGTIFNGIVNMGLAFSANNELFVTHSDSTVSRYLFNPTTGAAIPNGSFVVPGASRLHGLTFNSQGELFIADIDTDLVFRYLFDSSGNATGNGAIFAPGGPIGVAFSSDGELFASLHFSGGISRFLFDSSGNATANGLEPTPRLGGLAVFPSGCAEPPEITSASANPSVLWPPNHKMVDVTISYDVSDDCDAPGDIACSLSVTSNEPVDDIGDGNTSPDWVVVDAHHVMLRAERAGNGSGRIYTVTITCTDSSGNSTSTSVTVMAPHSQS